MVTGELDLLCSVRSHPQCEASSGWSQTLLYILQARLRSSPQEDAKGEGEGVFLSLKDRIRKHISLFTSLG